MSQNRFSVPTWSYAFESVRPARIIELGTSVGGFTCCMGIAARNIGAKVLTFDLELPPAWILEWFAYLPISYYRMDVLSEEGVKKIKTFLQDEGVAVVLCDGGRKAAEFAVFASALKQFDVIAAHDYQHPEHWCFSEISDADVHWPCKDNGLVPFMQDDFHKAGWLVRQKQ